MKGIADRLVFAQIGSEYRNAVLIQRHRRRGRCAAGQRYRRDTGQPLKFQPHHGVLADRSADIDRDQSYDPARVVELERLYLSDLHAVEIDVAALAQAAGGTLEHDTHRSLRLDTADFADPE